MATFILIWLGQFVSIIGSGLTTFSLSIWVYQKTGSVTSLALVSLFTILPSIIISPIAGVLVDRWQYRWVLIVSNFVISISTGMLCLLIAINRLEIWHIYFSVTISSIFATFHRPAYTAATSLLVPKQQLVKASGMTQLAPAVSQLISPILSSVLFATIKLQGVILIDFVSFIFALVSLLLVKFPNTKTTAKEKLDVTVILRDTMEGWKYINARPGLIALLIFLNASSFLIGMASILITPLILSFESLTVLGTISSIGGVGFIIGSLIMGSLGKIKRSMNHVFRFMLLNGLCLMVIGLSPSTPVLSVVFFLFFLGMAPINGSIQVIFQKKVALNVQGRVFAFNATIIQVFFSLAYAITGILVDSIKLISSANYNPVTLLFIIIGILFMLVTFVGYMHPRLRFIESELPDAL